jgi:hypothetical protein
MYRIIGADQREYGPVSADQVRAWILQARLNGRTLLRLENEVGWKPLSDFPEFAATLAQAGPFPIHGQIPSASPTQDNGMATASIILACISLFCCQPLGLVSLILGILALTKTSADPNRGGRGLAIAGIVVSVLCLAMFGLLMAFGAFGQVIEKFIK